MNKVGYFGIREEGVARVYRFREKTDSRAGVPLDPRLELRNHSPTGFEWGYGGSGPAQLSLAILADYLKNDQQALEYYQSFKFAVIGALPREKSWVLTEVEIEAAIHKIRLKQQGHGDGAGG